MARKKKNNKRPVQDGMNYTTYNNRVVEAKLVGTRDSFDKYLASIVGEWGGHYLRGVYGGVKMADAYIGRAYCNVDMGEEFDLEVGKQIATQRCLEVYHEDFDKHIVAFLEELHEFEARLFNRLRKANKLNLYTQAKDVDEIYDGQFRMEGQKSFLEILMNNCPDFFEFIACDCHCTEDDEKVD